jgi:transcriptional regulator with XRE-family HTH domain
MVTRLKQARLARNMTQRELAELIGRDRSFISHLERGSEGASVRTWDRIEAVLGIDQRILRQAETALEQ